MIKLKRFLVFYGAFYYPSCGMGDLLTHCDTLEEANKAVEDKLQEEFKDEGIWDSLQDFKDDFWPYNWAHIYDTHELKNVWESPR
jgi:hypothetical protein